ncbi:MAG TPA: extracellular solute-binding protein, partial [Candidatus Hydrogenedentes bacterium]|nr:extracellular solute-binding protein [Candidatus Hydrogenedentota bacterium]
PGYAWATFISLVQRCGGLAAINRLNAMEPGAFAHPDAVRAAVLVEDMAVRYFQRGAMAMTHTESQLQFVNNQAAMIFCGPWLENEMKNCIPPGFEMRCFNVPAVEDGKGNPNLCNGSGGEFLFVPADARYPAEAMAFARYLISPANAGDMTAAIGNLSSLKGCMNRAAVSPALESVIDMIEQSPGIFDCRLPTLLLEWDQQVKTPLLASLLRGEITPEEFCRGLDEGIAAAGANPDLNIPEHVPYDPAAFGESHDD